MGREERPEISGGIRGAHCESVRESHAEKGNVEAGSRTLRDLAKGGFASKTLQLEKVMSREVNSQNHLGEYILVSLGGKIAQKMSTCKGSGKSKRHSSCPLDMLCNLITASWPWAEENSDTGTASKRQRS